MPDPSTPLEANQTGFSRVCPSCSRRVPRNVATCRCGATLPVEGASLPPLERASTSMASFIAVAIIGVAAIAGVAYWSFSRPAPETTAIGSRSRVANREVAPTAAPRVASAEARAWDAAAAGSSDALPPSATTDSRSAAPSPLSAPSGSIEDMVDRAMPAVVLIETTTGRGSGFFVARDTLITNVHVVGNDSYVTLRRMDGSSLTARVDKKAPAYDIAILKIAQPSPSQPALPMATAHALKPGQEVIVIGSALGTLQNSVSRGIVSGLRSSGGATLVQTDAATNPGNSGGPMLDRTGSVIGITTMGYRNAEGLNFGVAIDHARDLLEGRQVNLGSERGLTDIDGRRGVSETDRQQQQGDQQWRAAITRAIADAREIDTAWQRFRKQCYTSQIAGSYQREWFAVLVPRGMPGNAAVGCVQYYATLQTAITEFKTQMQHAISEARRANVVPGTIRDALQSNRLDFDWER